MPKNTKTTRNRQNHAQDNRTSGVVDAVANRLCSVAKNREFEVLVLGRELLSHVRYALFHRVGDLHGVGIRAFIDVHRKRALAVDVNAIFFVLQAVLNRGHFIQSRARFVADETNGCLANLLERIELTDRSHQR